MHCQLYILYHNVLLEAIFGIHCPAPRAVQLQRFLPLSMLRIVTDGKSSFGDSLSEERLSLISQRVPRRSAQELVRHIRPRITKLIEQTRTAAQSQLAPIIETATDAVTVLEGRELARLKALAKVNPNIRGLEIDHIQSTIETLDRSLRAASLKLEGIRVMVTT